MRQEKWSGNWRSAMFLEVEPCGMMQFWEDLEPGEHEVVVALELDEGLVAVEVVYDGDGYGGVLHGLQGILNRLRWR